MIGRREYTYIRASKHDALHPTGGASTVRPYEMYIALYAHVERIARVNRGERASACTCVSCNSRLYCTAVVARLPPSPQSQSSRENVLNGSNTADLHKSLKSKVSAPTNTSNLVQVSKLIACQHRQKIQVLGPPRRHRRPFDLGEADGLPPALTSTTPPLSSFIVLT